MLLIREGKPFKTAKYFLMETEEGKRQKISYRKACEIEESALIENRIENRRMLCGGFLCIERIK